jgi:hypothetical protein
MIILFISIIYLFLTAVYNSTNISNKCFSFIISVPEMMTLSLQPCYLSILLYIFQEQFALKIFNTGFADYDRSLGV